MQDFLDKLDDELNNMKPKKENNTPEVVITSVSNKKTNTKISKKVDEKIKKYDYSKKNKSLNDKKS
jgi:cell division protein FtsX